MLPSLTQGPERPSLLTALKTALTQSSGSQPAGPAQTSSLNLKGLYNLVLGPKPPAAGASAPSAPQEPHLLGQRPVLNQFQDPLSASLNRMRLILPVSDGGGAVARDPPSIAPQPSPQQKPLNANSLQLELPRDDRADRRVQEQQQRVQEYQLAQMPLESQRRSGKEREDVVYDGTGRPIMRRGHAESMFDRVARGSVAALGLTFSLFRGLLALSLRFLPLRLRLKLSNGHDVAQTPRMRAPRG